MSGKSIWATLGALAMGVTLAVSVMAANPCKPSKDLTDGCKNEIAACKTARSAECAGLTKKDLRKCKANVRKCKKDTIQACKADSGATCSGSPSGAFID